MGKNGRPVTTRGIHSQLKHYAVRYGIDPDTMYPHSFRHRFAKNFLARSSDISLLADLLGHESIETTMKYVGVSSEQMVQALCSMEENLTLGVEKKYKKIRNKDSLATVLGLR